MNTPDLNNIRSRWAVTDGPAVIGKRVHRAEDIGTDRWDPFVYVVLEPATSMSSALLRELPDGQLEQAPVDIAFLLAYIEKLTEQVDGWMRNAIRHDGKMYEAGTQHAIAEMDPPEPIVTAALNLADAQLTIEDVVEWAEQDGRDPQTDPVWQRATMVFAARVDAYKKLREPTP